MRGGGERAGEEVEGGGLGRRWKGGGAGEDARDKMMG